MWHLHHTEYREDNTIKEVIESLRDRFNVAGSDIVLLDDQDGIVHVQLLGAWEAAQGEERVQRLTEELASTLRRQVPGFREIVPC